MMQAAVRCYCRKRICGAFCERDVIPADPKQWPRCECGEAMEFIVVHPDKLLGVTSLKDLARQVEGNVARHTLERLDSFVSGVAGKRLTYKALIA